MEYHMFPVPDLQLAKLDWLKPRLREEMIKCNPRRANDKSFPDHAEMIDYIMSKETNCDAFAIWFNTIIQFEKMRLEIQDE